MKNIRGISLIALIVTIIVLIIISSITIYTGGNMMNQARIKNANDRLQTVANAIASHEEELGFANTVVGGTSGEYRLLGSDDYEIMGLDDYKNDEQMPPIYILKTADENSNKREYHLKTPTTIKKNAFINCNNLKYIIFKEGIKNTMTCETTSIPQGQIYVKEGSGINVLCGKQNIQTYSKEGQAGDKVNFMITTNENKMIIHGIDEMNNFTKIEDQPWRNENGNSIVTVEIDEYITSIGSNAFGEITSITNVIIPQTVNLIGEYLLRGCTTLQSVTVREGNTKYCSDSNGVLYEKNGDKRTIIQYPVGRTDITSYSIESTVTQVKKYAFEKAQYLTTITIPKELTTI
ncbi:MAG: leucine-rich repeat protein, partial [Clostridia bacterium]|nr:leucine-rich repeat protein [Clostridia bacterium]